MNSFRSICRALKAATFVSDESLGLISHQLSNRLSWNNRNVNRYASTSSARPGVLTKDDKRDFMAVFPDIVRELTETDKPEMNLLLSKVLQYNVPGGKKTRGLTVVSSYRQLTDPANLTEENIRLSQILGWCVEMLQAHFIICDDVVDRAETRRGRPCWYKLPEVGNRAVTDALLIESNIYTLLRSNFYSKPYYSDILELFIDTIGKTVKGQCLDGNTSLIKSFAKRYTMDRYISIIKLKTSYYSFHLPVALAMHQAGIKNPELHRQARSILLEIGRYFQVQDDYLDVFGDPKEIGKDGSDIREGKCTWLAVVALHKANNKQRVLFEECYGSADDSKVSSVKELYVQLGLPALYAAFEEETYNLIFTQIQQLSQGLPHHVFLSLLDRTHKRDK